MLFNVYAKLLGEIMQRFGHSCQYANNTQLHLALPADAREAVETVNRCMVVVLELMRSNNLKFNPGKTEVLLV